MIFAKLHARLQTPFFEIYKKAIPKSEWRFYMGIENIVCNHARSLAKIIF